MVALAVQKAAERVAVLKSAALHASCRAASAKADDANIPSGCTRHTVFSGRQAACCPRRTRTREPGSLQAAAIEPKAAGRGRSPRPAAACSTYAPCLPPGSPLPGMQPLATSLHNQYVDTARRGDAMRECSLCGSSTSCDSRHIQGQQALRTGCILGEHARLGKLLCVKVLRHGQVAQGAVGLVGGPRRHDCQGYGAQQGAAAGWEQQGPMPARLFPLCGGRPDAPHRPGGNGTRRCQQDIRLPGQHGHASVPERRGGHVRWHAQLVAVPLSLPSALDTQHSGASTQHPPSTVLFP